MKDFRRLAILLIASMAALCGVLPALAAQAERISPTIVLDTWYKVTLELVRHTPTYSPPVASRTLAYVGITAFEAVAGGSPNLRSLAGQLNGLQATPQRSPGAAYDEAVVLNAALTPVVATLFANTGPTGQRVMERMSAKMRNAVAEGLPTDIVARSEAQGHAIANHILAWAESDGGAVIENMGFPLKYELNKDPAHWVPTSLIAQQQYPLLPEWGRKRTFAMPDGAACPLPPPPEYSEDKTSIFYKQALEVAEARRNLTPEQREIARFWADDAMLSTTPPGHWISISLQILDRDKADIERRVEVLARLGIAVADAFVGCWNAKFQYGLVRPITYIRRVIDPKREYLLITPPFPEYPSGHSTQSGAAAAVLTDLFGENFAFEDRTSERDGMKARQFGSFWEAANEAGISRLYGGIHYRAAIEEGLQQGRCVAAYVNALQTRR